MKLLDAAGLVGAVILAALLYYQFSKSERYRPTIADFEAFTTVSGVFSFTDAGKALQSSWIDGTSIYEAASYAGGHGGFGLSYHIPDKTRVKAQLVHIQTRAGRVWVASRIQSEKDGQVYVSRSPAELLDMWRANSRDDLFSSCLGISVAFVGTYLLLRGILKNV